MKKKLLAGLLAGTLVFSSSALFASESDGQYVGISPTSTNPDPYLAPGADGEVGGGFNPPPPPPPPIPIDTNPAPFFY